MLLVYSMKLWLAVVWNIVIWLWNCFDVKYSSICGLSLEISTNVGDLLEPWWCRLRAEMLLVTKISYSLPSGKEMNLLIQDLGSVICCWTYTICNSTVCDFKCCALWCFWLTRVLEYAQYYIYYVLQLPVPYDYLSFKSQCRMMHWITSLISLAEFL